MDQETPFTIIFVVTKQLKTTQTPVKPANRQACLDVETSKTAQTSLDWLKVN